MPRNLYDELTPGSSRPQSNQGYDFSDLPDQVEPSTQMDFSDLPDQNDPSLDKWNIGAPSLFNPPDEQPAGPLRSKQFKPQVQLPEPPPHQDSWLEQWNKDWFNTPLIKTGWEHTAERYDPSGAWNDKEAWRIPNLDIPGFDLPESFQKYNPGGGTWRSLGAGILQGKDQFIEGASTPLNIGITAATLGQGAAASAGYGALAKELGYLGRFLSVPGTLAGVGNTWEGIKSGDLGKVGMGIGETAGNLANVLHVPGAARTGRGNGSVFGGEVPPEAKQAGRSSAGGDSTWNVPDFSQPITPPKGLLGAAPEPVVTLESPDMASIQHWRDQGYVKVDPDARGNFRMARADVADRFINQPDPNRPFTPEEMTGNQDINLQSSPENVIPFPNRPQVDPVTRLDSALTGMGAGNRTPAHNQGDPAWEESVDDAVRNGPVGIVQNPVADLRQQNIFEQQNLPLNKRVIERAQRGLRDSVPTAPETEVPDTSEQYPLPLTMDVGRGGKRGGPGSPGINEPLIQLRNQLGREPTNEELMNAMYGQGEPTSTHQFNSITEIMEARSNGVISDQEYLAAIHDHQERQWSRPSVTAVTPTPEAPRDRTRVGGRPAPPDPIGSIATGIEFINGINDPHTAFTESRMYHDEMEAARYDGDHARVERLQYLSDYAADREAALRANPVPDMDSLTDNWEDDEIPIEGVVRDGRMEIDDATSSGDVIRLERYWMAQARDVETSDPVRYRAFRDLAKYASDRAAGIPGQTNPDLLIGDDQEDPINPMSMSRMRHRANVARARDQRLQEESQYTTSPLPVYGTHMGQQTMPGMKEPPRPLIKEGHTPVDPNIEKTIQKLYKRDMIPNLKTQRWWDQKIPVSQATLDAFDATIASVDPGNLSRSISHAYARSVLMNIREGEPGITIEDFTDVGKKVKDITYRAPDRKGVARATVEINDSTGDITIPSLASDKESGLYGRAVIAIARELVKLGAFKPGGSYSTHTANFMKEIRNFAVVDESISDTGVDAEVRKMVEEAVMKEAPDALGEELDEVTEAVQEAQAEAAATDSPITTGEVIDRVLERRNEARKLRIEKGEILGGPPDDNGPGTEVGSIFGAMGSAAGKVKAATQRAGWGQGRNTPASRPNNPNANNPQYNWIQEAMQVPRNSITTIDVSYAGRQGMGAITRPEFWSAFFKQFKGITQAGFDAIDQQNRSNRIWQHPIGAPTRAHPNGAPQPSLGERMGLTLFEQAGNQTPGPRMQQVASKWLEQGIGNSVGARIYRNTYGKLVRASNRMYLTMGNTLVTHLAENLVEAARIMADDAANRAGTYGTTTMRPGILKQKVTAAQAAEYNPYLNENFLKEIGDFVRTATGQAPLRVYIIPHKDWETNAEAMAGFLNKTIFSSGLAFSRLRMTQPGTYMMATPPVRKEYMRSALGIAAYWWGSAYAMKMALEALDENVDINLDITSSDFGKGRIGNMRMDFGGGHQQFLVNYGRLWAGGKTSSASSSPSGGNFQKFGEGYRAETVWDNLERFGANKLEPVTKFAYDLAKADERNPFHVGDRLAQLVVPLFIQDLMSISQENPNLLPLAIPTAFGNGTQIYDANENPGKIVPPEYDWIIGGGGGVRSLMPWNWGEEKGEYQGPNR